MSDPWAGLVGVAGAALITALALGAFLVRRRPGAVRRRAGGLAAVLSDRRGGIAVGVLACTATVLLAYLAAELGTP